MYTEYNEVISNDIEQYLHQYQNNNVVRFITCGSEGDGKSTLTERLLYESKALFEGSFDSVEANSNRWETQGGDMDFHHLVDGRSAEKEQGSTIDVAYRFFSTEQRKFIVADTSDHEQCTLNMITGTSAVDIAVILIDARQGVLTQTRRHSYLSSLIGIKNVVLAVNKMDLVNYSEETFMQVVNDYIEFGKKIGIDRFNAIPISALKGDNIIDSSSKMPWYQGTTLMSYLETVRINAEHMQESPFRLPVQWVDRPDLGSCGFAGTVASGVIKPGDNIRVQPSGKQSSVNRIVTQGGDLEQAVAGQSITLTLNDEIDISRGDVISTAEAPAHSADQFETTIVWMHEGDMFPGRPYLLQIGTQTVTATITDIKYEVNVNTLEHVAAKSLHLNDIGICNISTDRPIAYDSYKDNHEMGRFILIDRITNNTVGAGMLNFALRRSDNIHMQAVDIDKTFRSGLKKQKSCILWFTGLSGSGKSTVANLVEIKLAALGRHTYLLDGDNVRHGLNRDLGFTDTDRVENIRRIGEVASLMVDSGLIVLTAFISPFRSERRMARDLVDQGEFFEVHVDVPLSIAEDRDPKGLYKKARRGELKNFTGIDSSYETPENTDIYLDTSTMTAEQAAERVIDKMRKSGIINRE